MAAVKITVRKNGPYRVEAPEGSIELVDADGQKYDLTGKPAFSLCRCGGSVTKPFCGGTHSRIGFCSLESDAAAGSVAASFGHRSAAAPRGECGLAPEVVPQPNGIVTYHRTLVSSHRRAP